MSGHQHMGGEPVNAPIFPPPPIVLLLFIAAGFLLQSLFPLGRSEGTTVSTAAGDALMVLAFAISVLAARELARYRTAIHAGAAALALVKTGVYQRSRNPIYLSFIFFIVGLGLAADNPWMIFLAPLLLLYLQERVVKREETYLTAQFGPEYGAYRKRVRRWF